MTRAVAAVLSAVLSAALAAAPPLRAQDRTDLAAALSARIASSGATVGLYYHHLRRPDSLLIAPDLTFHAASTMKVAVMVQVFRDVDAGLLALDQRLPVVNTFHSLIGDTAYTLDRGDDSDSTLYLKVGDSVKVRDLVELMITVSSNLATNILIDRVGAARVQATLRELGIDSLRVRRGVEDGPAFRAGLNNTTTARALGDLLGALADGRAASPSSCGAMLGVLLRQRFNDGIPAGLPRRTRVAHKTGNITALRHDAGIVYVSSRPDYVLVVLTRGIEDQAAAAALIADLTRIIHTRLYPPPPPRPARRFN